VSPSPLFVTTSIMIHCVLAGLCGLTVREPERTSRFSSGLGKPVQIYSHLNGELTVGNMN
jgi:hypothetical protein